MTRSELIMTNKAIRKADDSHLWPIRGRFNVANRAIRMVRGYLGQYFHELTPETYRATVEAQASEIVNNDKNW